MRLCIVERLLSDDAAVGPANRDSYTPLHLATKSGHLSIAELLLTKGASHRSTLQINTTTPHYTMLYRTV